MSERFTKTDVRRSFDALRAELASRGVDVNLRISSPGDGVTRYWVTKKGWDGKGEDYVFPYAFMGAKEAYKGLTTALRLFEMLEA